VKGRLEAMPARKKAPDVPLTREHIVSTALALVDREGLGALSMRRLGAELDVNPMAVYYHVPSKSALLDAIVEAVMTELDLSHDDPSAPPADRILTGARAYRDAMLAHVNALPAVLSRGPRSPAALRPVELLVGVLRDAGLPPQEAVAGMNALAALVRGIVAMAVMEPPSADAAAAETGPGGAVASPTPDPDVDVFSPDFFGADFDLGVRALARGLLEGAREPQPKTLPAGPGERRRSPS
jgi:AcrR family transcriptional regulator